MTATITKKRLVMTPGDYRAAAKESVGYAVEILRDEAQDWGRSGRLKSAAELLDAADTFERRAGVMENFDHSPDTVDVEDSL